ncbi:MAG: DUF433 domain-containing protein [Dehalococcoidia bacterium]|nr:MAG: DUF433 domain-containing protein [Dehalococcoidia bacterium]
MTEIADLLDRRLYGIGQVDRLLALVPGTARRWIEGYRRAGRSYEPVIRAAPTHDEVVTWGEFVETRLLAEYRSAGVPLIRMRPAIVRLREIFDTRYPLAHARPFISAEGRELVLKVQEEVDLEQPLVLVVVRSGQVVLSHPATEFVNAVKFGSDETAISIRPLASIEQVVIDPLRQFGEPVVRSVPTENIAELVRAGDRLQMIAELYDLTVDEVEAAVRYELSRKTPAADRAA